MDDHQSDLTWDSSIKSKIKYRLVDMAASNPLFK
jgi:hypothetical protein